MFGSSLDACPGLACALSALSVGHTAHAQQSAPVIVGATVIAESLPVGFRVSAVAVEYSTQLDPGSAAIPTSTFAVVVTPEPVSKIAAGPRTITRACTSNRIARADRATPGQFIILELSPTDPNGAANYYGPTRSC